MANLGSTQNCARVIFFHLSISVDLGLGQKKIQKSMTNNQHDSSREQQLTHKLLEKRDRQHKIYPRQSRGHFWFQKRLRFRRRIPD